MISSLVHGDNLNYIIDQELRQGSAGQMQNPTDYTL